MSWFISQQPARGITALREVSLSDQQFYNRMITETEYPVNLWSGNFAYIWAVSRSQRQKMLWQMVDGMLATYVLSSKGSLYLFCLPFGKGGPEKVTKTVKHCLELCLEHNGGDTTKSSVRMLNQGQLEWLRGSSLFEKYFRLVTWRGIERHFSVPALVELKGSDFSRVRNRVSKFHRENPGARLREYTPADFEKIMALGKLWHDTAGQKYSYVFDGVYFYELIKNSEALGQTTLVMEKDGELIGMVAGGLLPGGESWGSLVKFRDGVPGLSETLIVEYARRLAKLSPGLQTLNVGSDLGPGGLRDYKLKFRPVLSFKRYEVHMRETADEV